MQYILNKIVSFLDHMVIKRLHILDIQECYLDHLKGSVIILARV